VNVVTNNRAKQNNFVFIARSFNGIMFVETKVTRRIEIDQNGAMKFGY
jgi:hypothetical protein